MSVLKCNHDAQFVVSSGSKDTATYVVKYGFKNQHPVDNHAALSLAAFAKAAMKANTLPSDATDMERSCRMLGSMLYTITNEQEVADRMAALYLLNERPFWFSHGFVHMNLRSMLQKRVESVELSLSQKSLSDRNNISTDIILDRYWKRQASLENIPFIDICEKYKRVGKSAAISTDSNSAFRSVHFTNMTVGKVLVICGEEIPDIASNLESSTFDYFYEAVLTLSSLTAERQC